MWSWNCLVRIFSIGNFLDKFECNLGHKPSLDSYGLTFVLWCDNFRSLTLLIFLAIFDLCYHLKKKKNLKKFKKIMVCLKRMKWLLSFGWRQRIICVLSQCCCCCCCFFFFFFFWVNNLTFNFFKNKLTFKFYITYLT